MIKRNTKYWLAIQFYKELGNKFECEYKGKGRCKGSLVFHHRDGNKKNNNSSNFQILCRKHHGYVHKKEQAAMSGMKGGMRR